MWIRGCSGVGIRSAELAEARQWSAVFFFDIFLNNVPGRASRNRKRVDL
jgi:hypothetical protein